MRLKHVFTAHSVVALVNGAGCVLAPKSYPSLFGISLSGSDAIFMARLLGAALLTYCSVAWFARDARDSAARRAIVLGFFISVTIGFILSLLAQLSGVMDALGWGIVGLYFLMGLGYGYFHFIKPEAL